MEVIDWMERASRYPPHTIEGKRRQLIMFILKAALGVGDIKPYDEIENAVEKVSKTIVQLKNLWDALKKEKPHGVI